MNEKQLQAMNLSTEQEAVALVDEDGLLLEWIPARQRTTTVCFTAVNKSAEAFRFIPHHVVLGTPSMAEIACKADGKQLAFVPPSLVTEALCLAAVKSDGAALPLVPKRFQTDEIVFEAVSQNGAMLAKVASEQKTHALVRAAVDSDPSALEHCPKHLLNEAVVMSAVRQRGEMLRAALNTSDSSAISEAVCMAAVTSQAGDSGEALIYVLEKYITPELLRAAVMHQPTAIEMIAQAHASHLSDDLCRVAVERDGMTLRFFRDAPFVDAEMCELALRQNGAAFQYVPEALKSFTMAEAAVRDYGAPLSTVPARMMTNYLLQMAIERSDDLGATLDAIPVAMRTADIARAVLEQDPHAEIGAFFDEETLIEARAGLQAKAPSRGPGM